jgi:aspartyl/glutamyl-tRNA(Asn/Gln) amidotransferase C subunit
VASREEILAIARLARLAFTTDELDDMTRELRGILTHVAALQRVARAVDTVDQPDTEMPLRTDVPAADPLAMQPSGIAPEWRDGFFTVPRLRTHDR